MDLARAERLTNLSLDYRVALAHSPIQPQQVQEVRAGWLAEDEHNTIWYGFVLSYRSRYVYLYGHRNPKRESATHTMQWFDKEPHDLYTRNRNWYFDLAEIMNGPYFLSDEEADRPSPVDDNSDPEC